MIKQKQEDGLMKKCLKTSKKLSKNLPKKTMKIITKSKQNLMMFYKNMTLKEKLMNKPQKLKN